MAQSHTICWHIFRMGNKHILVKAAGKDCPCQHDPIRNPQCKDYEATRIHQE
jgi:hypothetical protein